MPVERFRSIEEMQPIWREPDDPANLRDVAMMMSLHLRLSPPPSPGVRRFRSIEEANAERGDPIRQAKPELFSGESR